MKPFWTFAKCSLMSGSTRSRKVIQPSAAAVTSHSADESLVFLFCFKGSRITDPFDGSFEELLPNLPVVVLVLAGEDIDLDAEPEQGKASEMAAAVDAATDSRKKALEKEKAAEKAADVADKKLRKVEAADSSEKDRKDLKGLKTEAETKPQNRPNKPPGRRPRRWQKPKTRRGKPKHPAPNFRILKKIHQGSRKNK